MKNKVVLILLPVVLLVVGAIGYFLLSGSENNVWSECVNDLGMPNDLNSSIVDYYTTNHSQLSLISDSCNVFVDCSDGISFAWTNDENKTLLKNLANLCMNFPNSRYYNLYNDTIHAPTNFDTDAGDEIMNFVKGYKEKKAPIDFAFRRITNGNSQAVLITDMELYESNGSANATIKTTRWSEQYMKKWLDKGNSIEIRYSSQRYTDKALGSPAEKLLYFIFFIPNGISQERNIYENFKVRSNFSKGFSLSPRSSIAFNEYGGVDKTGLKADFDSNDGNLKIVNACLSDKLNFEFIDHQGYNWDYINEMISSGAADKNDFLRKLYLDLSHNETFSIDDLELEVYDVSEDFTKFCKWNCIKNLKPQMTKDGDQNNVWAESVSALEREVFEDNSTNLKEEYKYSFSGGEKLEEVFAINKSLLRNGLSQNRKKVEVGIDFHPNFNYEKFKGHANGLIRIDVVVNHQTWNSGNIELENLKWTGEGGDSFVEAIKDLGTLPKNISCQPTGENHRVLYTYFLRMSPNE
jgi:hypothetical protein